jgi:hypothetical protein
LDLVKLYYMILYGKDWTHKWIDHKNIDHWEEFEKEMRPGETFKDYRQRMDEVGRKVNELRNYVKRPNGSKK